MATSDTLLVCAACGTGNRAGRRWCAQCGARLAVVACERCGFDNLPGENFCGGCGLALAGVAPAVASPPASAEAERRQLTVMFCDLVGSTALSGQLDPEDLAEVIRSFQGACAEQIARYEGFIARYMGDGLLVYFGYPQAHEDDAERAVRAALGIVSAVAALAQPVKLGVRVGVATGRVVAGDLVGQGASEERAVVGPTPNLAARLQALAQPDTVVISDATRRLVGHAILVEDLGEHALKGFDEPVRAWRAAGERQVTSRFEARQQAGLAPFVGRESELAQVLARWETARGGRGQVVVISGEAGIGKSRLLWAFEQRIDAHVPRVRLQCSPHHRSTALHPIIEELARQARFEPADNPAERAAKLTRMVGDSNPRAVAALGQLMGLSGELPAFDGGADQLRRIVFETLWMLLARLVGDQCAVAVVEDLQWVDATTARWVEELVERAAASRLLVLVTHRPDHAPGWPSREHLTRLSLGRLANRESLELVRGVVAEQALPAGAVQRIVDRAEGVPAFAEELTRAVLAAAAAGEQAPEVPATLQDSLMARLDRLVDAREVAQTAAVIGREFPGDLLERSWEGDPRQLHRGLRQLVDAGLVTAPGIGTSANYSFRHNLLRDVAYDSLLHRTRRMHHGRVASALVEHFPERAEAAPEVVARHLTEAGRTDEAVAWWKRAARQAQARGATAEAVDHLSCAVKLLERVGTPDDREIAAELAPLRVQLALELRNMSRFDEALETLERAESQARSHDLGETLSHVHYARGNLFFLMGQPQRVREEHERALEEARKAGSVEAEIQALGGLADADMAVGDLPRGKVAVAECIARAEAEGLERIVVVNLPLQGYFHAYALELEEAVRCGEEGYRRARAMGHARAALVALSVLQLALCELGQHDEAERWAVEHRRMAARAGPTASVLGMFMDAHQLQVAGHFEEAERLGQHALDVQTGHSDRRMRPAIALIAACRRPADEVRPLVGDTIHAIREVKAAYVAMWGGLEALHATVRHELFDLVEPVLEAMAESMPWERIPFAVDTGAAARAAARWSGTPDDPAALSALRQALADAKCESARSMLRPLLARAEAAAQASARVR